MKFAVRIVADSPGSGLPNPRHPKRARDYIKQWIEGDSGTDKDSFTVTCGNDIGEPRFIRRCSGNRIIAAHRIAKAHELLINAEGEWR